MFTTFTRDDKMLASELMHQVTQQIPTPLASLVRNELGAPSMHKKTLDAWYARAHISERCDDMEACRAVPFALRCDQNGNWFLSCSPFDEMELAEAFGTLVPGIEFIELPRSDDGRVRRAA